MDAYKKTLWVVLVVLIVAVSILAYFMFFKTSPTRPPLIVKQGQPRMADPPKIEIPRVEEKVIDPVPVRVPEPEPATTPGIADDVVLGDSDDAVRRLVADLSLQPEFGRWMKEDNLLRRLVAIVDNIASGSSPAPHLKFLQPTKDFPVIRRGDTIVLDPAGYDRYRLAAVVVSSLDANKLAAHYRQLMPLLDEAYRELGHPDGRFHDALRQAVVVLLQTPVIEDDILLTEKVTTYAFADIYLEDLNEAQKHFLRMGPENIKRVHAKLKELATALRNQSTE